MSDNPVFARLDGTRTSVVWMHRGDALDCLYLGAKLPAGEDLAMLAQATKRSGHENQPDVRPVGALLPDPRTGWRGPTLLEMSKDGEPIQPGWSGLELQSSGSRLMAVWRDEARQAKLHITWKIGAGDVITAKTEIVSSESANRHEFSVQRLASLLLPLPRGFDHVTHFAGRWADDMRAERLPITRAGMSWASRGGKSAFAGGDWLAFDDERSGAHLGFHIAHSGDHETKIERNEDGLATLLSEAPTAQGAAALFTWAESEAELTYAFHIHAREQARQIDPYTSNPVRTRKVHFNTWEACAFDFDEARLMTLADDAATLGAERFVLDDGWFKGRRGDHAGLGDWTADAERFPNSLDPLIKHVKARGMDFGLWVEPEMVSPDSDLFRAHPDWCLNSEGQDRPKERNQLVLDLNKSDVFDYVLESIGKLLRDHDISYLKWDHNRRLFPNCGAQAARFRDLLVELRTAHPHVMIESCSSGGGRIDFDILGLCERFWPSDNNDPIERVRIMREWSRFLPLELLGNHVGPSPNPITGRQTDMDFRAKIALFGHLGIEADPGAMTDHERAVLSQHIALYKQWRDVLHSGAYHRLEHPDAGIFAQMVVGEEQALAVAAQTQFSPDFEAAPVRLAGLDPQARYRVTLPLPWSAKAALYLPDWQGWRDGITLSGQALMQQGIALPLTHPETAWLIALERLPE